MINKTRKFIDEVIAELKKVSWSTRQEVIDSTKVILISATLLGVFIFCTDFVLAEILKKFIR